MSDLLINHITQLIQLNSLSTHDLHIFFKEEYTDQLLNILSEISHNIYFNLFPLNDCDIIRLKPLRNTLQILSSQRISIQRKRRQLKIYGSLLVHTIIPIIENYLQFIQNGGKNGINQGITL